MTWKVPYTTWHITQWGLPSRGEVVVFFSPADGRRLVKRVVGLPGDRVAMRENVLFVNGAPLGYKNPQGRLDLHDAGSYCLLETHRRVNSSCSFSPCSPR